MKLHKRIIAAGLSAVLIFGASALPVAAAAANPFTWDGCSALAAERTYFISDNISVSGSFTLPAGSRITVLRGGNISVPAGSSLTIDGALSVENGASVNVSGTLLTGAGSDFTVSGILAAGAGSSVDVSGELLCTSEAQVSLLGSAQFGENSALYSYGTIYSAGSITALSVVDIYGGSLTVAGALQLGANSNTNISGSLSVLKNAGVTNSGAVTLGENSKYSLSGSFMNTDGGYVIDNRKAYTDNSMTAQALSLYTCDALKGIDVSAWQGDIDWAKVKQSGIDFAIIRSSRGRLNDDYPMTSDSEFHDNMLGAAKNGINVGVYHYCYGETVDEVRDEARMVLSLIQGYDVSYPIIFDIEDNWYINNGYSKETLTAMTAAFCDEIKKAGYMPMIYSYASFLDYYLDMDSLSEYPVWVAHVGVDKPSYDRQYFIWQYSWKGSISGIEGDVDLDYAYVDFASYIKNNKLNGYK